MSNRPTFTFGPVPSRRLGRSLGIDIVPFKTCTYNCTYCQLGKTTDRTVERQNFYAIEKILSDVSFAVKNSGAIDYLTLSGSGEPTLHTEIGTLIKALKREFDIPIAVLTNGSLLYEEVVADALSHADIVMPTLAADCEATFQCVHRPHPNLHFEKTVNGICEFRKNFKNHLWLEVFLLDGITAIEKTVTSMKKVVEMIGPERVQLNTATRPAAEDFIFPVKEEKLVALGKKMWPQAEIVSDFKDNSVQNSSVDVHTEESVLALLSRRPCTEKDISDVLYLHQIEAVKMLDGLSKKGIIELRRQNGKKYYTIKR